MRIFASLQSRRRDGGFSLFVAARRGQINFPAIYARRAAVYSGIISEDMDVYMIACLFSRLFWRITPWSGYRFIMYTRI